MAEKDTIIVVGITRLDEYNNLWVTPQDGGNEVKIGAKREHLHPLFEQGKSILLHWETYKNKPYVADAKLVEGKLQPPGEPMPPGEYPDKEQMPQSKSEFSPQEIGMWWKEVGEFIRAGWKNPELEMAYWQRMYKVVAIPLDKAPVSPDIVKKTEPSAEKKQTETEPIAAPTEPQTFAELRAWVIGHGKEYTLTWIVNTLKIPEADLRSDPNGCYHKIKDKMKWED